MGKLEWACVGVVILFTLLLLKEELSWLFSTVFLCGVAAAAGGFMYAITND